AHSAERLAYRMACPCCPKATEQAIASLPLTTIFPVPLQAVVTGSISESHITGLSSRNSWTNAQTSMLSLQSVMSSPKRFDKEISAMTHLQNPIFTNEDKACEAQEAVELGIASP